MMYVTGPLQLLSDFIFDPSSLLLTRPGYHDSCSLDVASDITLSGGSIWHSIRADCVRLLQRSRRGAGGEKDDDVLADNRAEQDDTQQLHNLHSKRVPMSTYSVSSKASTSGCGEFRLLNYKSGKSRPPPANSPQANGKELRLGEVISITIDLEVVITEGGVTKVTLREVPKFLVDAFNVISRKGKFEEGIFRKEGNTGRLKNIDSYAIFTGRTCLPPEFTDHVHDVCTLIKRFLRELKRPLLDSPIVRKNLFALAAKKTPISQAEFSSAFEVPPGDKRNKCEPMALPHIGTLGFIMRHLYNLSLYSSHHHMTPENMATVLAMVVFNDDVHSEKKRRESRRGSQEDLLTLKRAEMDQKCAVLRMLIEHANWIGVPSNPYVTSQTGTTGTVVDKRSMQSTEAADSVATGSDDADEKINAFAMSKCRSSSCIPRIRMPLSETSINTAGCGLSYSPPQAKCSLIDTAVPNEPKSAEPELFIPQVSITPAASRKNTADSQQSQSTPYSTPGSAVVGETRVITFPQATSEITSSVSSTPLRSSSPVSLRPKRRSSPPPPSFIPQLSSVAPSTNGEVHFRKPALPTSSQSTYAASSSFLFARPSLPVPRLAPARASRPLGVDNEFINSPANVISLKKGNYVSPGPPYPRPSVAMVGTLGLVQNGVKLFSQQQPHVRTSKERDADPRSSPLPPSGIPRPRFYPSASMNGASRPSIKRDENSHA